MLQNKIIGREARGCVVLVLDSYTNLPVYFTAFTGKVSLLVYKSSFFFFFFHSIFVLETAPFFAKYLENARAHIFISSFLFAETVLGRFVRAGKTPSC